MISLTSKTTHVPTRQKPYRPSHVKNSISLTVQRMFTLDLGHGVKVRLPIETRHIRLARGRAGVLLRRQFDRDLRDGWGNYRDIAEASERHIFDLES